MKRRALLLSLTLILMLCAACGWWLHRERRQYALNRQLIAALVDDNTKTALALVEEGADPNTRYDPPPTPSLKLLFNQFLHDTPPPTNDSPTALMLACGLQWPPRYVTLGWHWPSLFDMEHPPKPKGENVLLLRAMLTHGANVNLPADENTTALHSAVEHHRPHTLELLLQNGADVNVQNKWGDTPLILAVPASYSVDTVRPLLLHGANPNKQDKYGRTALYFAVLSRSSNRVFSELLAYGADPNLPNKQGRTPLQYAQRAKLPDIVRLLKLHGAK